MRLPASTIQVRENNTNLVRSVMRGIENTTKAHLASLTGLSVATCGKILNEMIADGEVDELELAASGNGRPPRLYAYNPLYALTARIFPKTVNGLSFLVYEVKDAKDNTVERENLEVEKAGIEAIRDLLDQLMLRYPSIDSVSLSIPGLIDGNRIGFCDIPELEGVNLDESILGKYNFGIYADNDMNLAALGYYHTSQCAGSVVYMVVPRRNCTGVGIVIDGRIVRGKSCFAGELSFIPFGVGREEQFSGLAIPDAISYTAKLAAAVIPVLNPSTLVIASEIMTPEALEHIQSFCGRHIPAAHLPEFVMKESMDDDCLAGLGLLGASDMERDS